VVDRPEDTTEPMLSEMALVALEHLDARPGGFFLMIEGARIDMASHLNDAERAVQEVLAFDETVRQVVAWAGDRPEVTIVVSADHETGGLEVLEDSEAGTLPQMRWLHREHTNRDIQLFAQGPETAGLHGALVDHRDVHRVLRRALTGDVLPAPPVEPRIDGRFDDLRYVAATQAWESDYGVDYNRLDALWIDAAPDGLVIGLEGLFEWDLNSVVVLIDVDYGAGTGVADFTGELTDASLGVDRFLSSMRLFGPELPGFGVDVALVNLGAQDVEGDELLRRAGARGLTEAMGYPANLAWLPSIITLGQGVRVRGPGGAPVPDQGMELRVPWPSLYGTADRVPPGAQVAVAAVLFNDRGGRSNQALPSFALAEGAISLDQVVVFSLDVDGDTVPDGGTPVLVP
jgi:hypothetical protein